MKKESKSKITKHDESPQSSSAEDLDTSVDKKRHRKDCKCVKIIGHLESVKWLQYPRVYQPSPGYLAMEDWMTNTFIWLHYVQSSDGILLDDDVLMSKDSRYWEIEDVQRYMLCNEHCEEVLFTYQYPYPRLPTPLGNVFWRSNIAMKNQSRIYRRELQTALEISLKEYVFYNILIYVRNGSKLGSVENQRQALVSDINAELDLIGTAARHTLLSCIKLEMERAQMDRLIIPDRIFKLDRFDYFRRRTFFRLLNNILSFQDRLQLVSFENLCCTRLEGVSLIQHLACFNADTLKYLFLWRFVLPNENPILINYTYITGSGQYIPRPDSKYTFIRSLGELRNLRVLALEYAHIADGTGGTLLSLLPVIKRPHFRLQLICREDQIPGRADAALGVGGYGIPDTAWRRVAIACPDIYLLLAFFRIRDYDNVRRFLTPSLPLREVHLQLGIDLKMRQRQDSDVSCFVRHIAYRYASTLATLSIHQWRFAVFPLNRILELMPRLVRLLYIGKVEDEVDLKKLCNMIACGACSRLKQVKIQIQDDEGKRSYWQNVVETLTEEYSEIMELYNIKFCLCIYKS